MSETFREQLERIESMSNPGGTWDLSDNDMGALGALLDHYRGAVAQIAALEAKLAACEWKPITETDLPKVGDEVWSATQNEYIPHEDMLLRNGVYVVEEATTRIENYRELRFTHFRPINPPQ